MVQFIIFGLKFIETFSLRNCDCLNEVSFTILEKVSINSKNYNLLHRFFTQLFSKKSGIHLLQKIKCHKEEAEFSFLLHRLWRYRGTPDSSGLLIRQAQS
jgi:hypothetical protein